MASGGRFRLRPGWRLFPLWPALVTSTLWPAGVETLLPILNDEGLEDSWVSGPGPIMPQVRAQHAVAHAGS